MITLEDQLKKSAKEKKVPDETLAKAIKEGELILKLIRANFSNKNITINFFDEFFNEPFCAVYLEDSKTKSFDIEFVPYLGGLAFFLDGPKYYRQSQRFCRGYEILTGRKSRLIL